MAFFQIKEELTSLLVELSIFRLFWDIRLHCLKVLTGKNLLITWRIKIFIRFSQIKNQIIRFFVIAFKKKIINLIKINIKFEIIAINIKIFFFFFILNFHSFLLSSYSFTLVQEQQLLQRIPHPILIKLLKCQTLLYLYAHF